MRFLEGTFSLLEVRRHRAYDNWQLLRFKIIFSLMTSKGKKNENSDEEQENHLSEPI